MPKRSAAFKADRRGEILDAAMRLFVEQGYDRTSMREIAAAAGVSTGAIYVYFQTKEEMLEAVCREEWLRSQGDLRTVMSAAPPGLDRITAGLAVGFGRNLESTPEQRLDHSRLNLMLLYETTRNPAFAETVRQGNADWRALISSVMQEEQQAGRIRLDADASAVADILMGLALGLELNELIGKRTLDWSSIITLLAELLWRGLAPAAQPVSAAPALSIERAAD